MKGFDSKSAIALVVITGCFTLLGIYVWEGRVPDAVIAAIVAGALSGVVNFFFGQHNGTMSGQLAASTQLAQALIAQLQGPLPSPPAPASPVSVTVNQPPAVGTGAAA